MIWYLTFKKFLPKIIPTKKIDQLRVENALNYL